jgi:hypothetical protein
MPITKHAKWMVVYTAPADGHKFKHVAHVNTVNDEAFARLVFKQNSPDSRILECAAYREPEDIFRKAEELKREGGPDWRPLEGDEFTLTTRQVRKLSAQYADIARRTATGIVDAKGNPIIPAPHRAALMADETPPTPAHVVSDVRQEATETLGHDE